MFVECIESKYGNCSDNKLRKKIDQDQRLHQLVLTD
jgi:hypothetical protein